MCCCCCCCAMLGAKSELGCCWSVESVILVDEDIAEKGVGSGKFFSRSSVGSSCGGGGADAALTAGAKDFGGGAGVTGAAAEERAFSATGGW